ncbi:Starch-binding associating with outer membrane [Daejeonella rubra]|uniref:Starch-binding associating with outer membrane n=1 Tax=Daejeonella rubra TaxID=990371 RepID=A0A1G9TWB1_9SPHI|nr:SusD/RagB family nutrient-binding outer membrane lipoprotein [Daejeonella rubra]SDM51977.1 Starch-binding associating with outer membrane [Daejeonella rubra]
MKRKYIYIIITALTTLFTSSCTKDFETVNVNPNVVTDVDVRLLFTSSLVPMQTSRGGEYWNEGFTHFLSACQLVTGQSYAVATTGVNSRYNLFYSSVLPNLVEMRRLIALKADKEKYEQINAITYIPQVMMALKVSDMNGSMPYTEANKGRDEAKYSPKYDNQETLYTVWLKELTDAIAILQKNSSNQVSFSNNDVFFRGDVTKWIKLANSLKLRIAARYQNHDATKATQIFKEVMADATGPFSSNADQLVHTNPAYYPFGVDGYNIDIYSRHFAVGTAVEFLKSSSDPRLGIYYDKNSLQGSYKDTLVKYSKTLPSWIKTNDANIMYQGGPADFQSNPAVSTYFVNPFNGGGANRYQLISTVNRKFFAPTVDRGSGTVVDVMFSYAEVCLQIAEFIQKGYGSGVNTKGTAAEWYNKGVRASANSMNDIAIAAGSTSYTNINALVDAHLANPKVKLDGTNDLEKIYIQELLNFYREPNEAFTLARRTGYPKTSSTLLAREPISDVLPRRWWTLDPGQVNRTNWTAAMTEQGFTPNDFTVSKLNSERIWFDKKSPDYGKGN